MVEVTTAGRLLWPIGQRRSECRLSAPTISRLPIIGRGQHVRSGRATEGSAGFSRSVVSPAAAGGGRAGPGGDGHKRVAAPAEPAAGGRELAAVRAGDEA